MIDPQSTADEGHMTDEVPLTEQGLRAAVHEALAARLPVGTGDTTLQFVPAPDDWSRDTGVVLRDDRMLATLRLISWDVDGDTRQINSIKEQQVVLAAGISSHLPERVLACVQGWLAALELSARWWRPAVGETLMPHDLYPSRVLNLRSAEHPTDFAAAFLQRSRLGRLTIPREEKSSSD